MSDSNEELKPQWNPLAAIAGWLVPGLGHIVLGQRRRGIIIGLAITALFLAGLLIGGISVIDKWDRGEQDDPALRGRSWWYFGQAMIAPAIAIERVRDGMTIAHAAKDDRNPRARLVPAGDDGSNAPPYEPSIGKVAEQGTLYTALAGMLNLLAIIDVLYCDPRARRQQPAATLRPSNIAEAV